MKKLGIVLVLALAAAGMAVAQTAPAPWGPYRGAPPEAQLVKVDGRLALINGMIGLKSGGKTYYVPMLTRLTGFMDSIKEGASVRLEGYEYQMPYAPEYYTLMATKLTVGGKDYDLSQYGGYGWHGGNRRGGMMGWGWRG